MAPPVPLLAVRGSVGTSLLCGPPKCEQHAAFQRDSGLSRCIAFSRDGTLFSWCNGHSVAVVKSSDSSVVATFDLPKTTLLDFSPLNNVLVTWQPYSKSQDSPQGEANLQLWDLANARLIKALYQKKVDTWCPSWSEDEKICVRSVNNELHFYENNDFNTIANKLRVQKVSDFALSPGGQPSKVAVYAPGSKGAPSFVRLYQYPVLGGPTAAFANKSFFKADRVTMQWNKKASAVLVTASTEVDKTGASYYGEQTLHYLAVNGETALVQLPKNGPIYDVAWSPNSAEFCVVYGFMPAKATIFNLRCDPVFDFGTGPRNAAYYSPQGHILVLAGFGNLRGQMEVWDLKKYKQVSKPQAPDATHFSWCPDGEHVVTATCSPRLRHEEEPPQNLHPGVSGEKILSKSALKNQRKREAKKAAKQESKSEPELPSDLTPVTKSQSELSSGDPETDKKIKNLKKKLKAIEELKEQQASGKVLQKNQLEKVQKEDQLLKELEDLQIQQ
uniref:eukaryotic translation initiation factor 2A isoform X2 n=1 Tax=Monopterus albus TaxID=43700 RepID=UPI0009B3102E|nr:eukaryotic translation initiation factor 2A isoform X2 [Monopterus albus]